MSTLRSIFEKYLHLPPKSSTTEGKDRKRKLSEDKFRESDGKPRTKLPRLSYPHYETTGFLKNVWPLSFGRSHKERKMDFIPLDSEDEDDFETLEFLKAQNLTPKTYRKLAGAPKVAQKPLPGLIPRPFLQESVQKRSNGTASSTNGGFKFSNPQSLSSESSQTSFRSDTNGVAANERLALWKKHLNRPPVPGMTRCQVMVNTARQKAHATEEKRKYGSMLNQMAPSIYPQNKSASLSLFSNSTNGTHLKRLQPMASAVATSQASAKHDVNLGSRNRYGRLLEEFTRKIERQYKEPVFTFVPTKVVDLTASATDDQQVELTDDDDDQAAATPPSKRTADCDMSIPKMFPYLNRSQSLRSPAEIIVLEDNDVIDVDSVNSATSSTHSTATTRRKAEPVEPVNTLLDELQANPMFHDSWLETTQRRYSRNKEERTRLMAEESEHCRQIEQDGRAEVRDIIKKLDAVLALNEVIVIEDEEEALKAMAVKDTPLPAFTGEQVDRIRYAMGRGRPDEVLITKFNLNITRRDVSTLIGDSWLNDEVINFYMNLLMERTGPAYPKVYAMNTFFIPKVLQSGQQGVRRWTRKVDIFSYDVIPVPVHVSNIHWCMAIIHLKDKSIRYYDSMGQPNKRVLDALEQYLKDESKDKRQKPFDTSDWRLESVADCPRQMNGSDCGVFSCMFAEYVTRNHRINFTQDNMRYFREKMILEIVTGKLLL